MSDSDPCGDIAATRVGSCRNRRPVHFPLRPPRIPVPFGVRGGLDSSHETETRKRTHPIRTAARNGSAFFACRVAMPCQRFK